MIEEVTDHLEALFVLKAHAGDVRADDKAAHQKERAAILASPVPVVGLYVLVEVVSVTCSI